MNEPQDWELFLRSRFPGYLLPESAAHRVSVAEAQSFLERLTGQPRMFEVARAASVLVPRSASLLAFARGPLPDLIRSLPSRTEVQQRRWEHGFRGRLDVPATLSLHVTGRETTFVTRDRRRVFDLPENAVVRGVVEMLLAAMERLRGAAMLPDRHWGAELRSVEALLRPLLLGTVLREVPATSVTSEHLNAARGARHPAYGRAAELWSPLHDALYASDPSRIARILADGALLPLEDYTRFELAVVIRLIEALRSRLGSSWRTEYGLISPRRRDVASLVRPDGLKASVFYNQAVLPSGAADADAAHYLGSIGRLRPDVTFTLERDDVRLMAFVIECKCSPNPDYIQQGLQEARLYRHEYAGELSGWPKSVLVATSSITGAARSGDDVIAVPWAAWVPDLVLDALVQRMAD